MINIFVDHDRDRVRKMFLKDRFAENLDIQIIEIEYGRAVVGLTITDQMLNGAGVANGGVVFTLADLALAIAANTLNESISLTLNMSINYIKSVFSGDVITATSACIPSSGKMVSCSVEVANQLSEVVASAHGLSYVSNKMQRDY